MSHLLDARERQLAIYRAMTPARRWDEARRLDRSMRALKRAYLAHCHTDWSDEELDAAVKTAFTYVRD